MLMVIIWWFVSAHKWFKGPVINVEVRTSHNHTRSISPNSPSIICLEEKMASLKESKEALIVKVSAILTRKWIRLQKLYPQRKSSSLAAGPVYALYSSMMFFLLETGYTFVLFVNNTFSKKLHYDHANNKTNTHYHATNWLHGDNFGISMSSQEYIVKIEGLPSK